jgi:hypothetical protein
MKAGRQEVDRDNRSGGDESKAIPMTVLDFLDSRFSSDFSCIPVFLIHFSSVAEKPQV